LSTLLLGKILSRLLLPPAGPVLLAAIGLVFWRRRGARLLVFLALACLWLLALEPVRDVLVRPLEPPPLAHVDRLRGQKAAIVLLGGGIYEQAPEFEGRDTLRPHALLRTVYAAELALRTGLPVYASGGEPFSHAVESEGAIMRRWLIRLGVPPQRVHAETAAANTWENAVRIRKMLATAGIRRVVLVTSAWHMPRAVWCFRKQHLEVVPAPTDYKSRQDGYMLLSYFPDWGVFADSGDILHEYLGLLGYRLRYGW